MQALRDRVSRKRNKNKKASCQLLKDACLLKSKNATSLNAGRDAASKPSISVNTETSALEGACDQRANSSLSTAAVSTLKTGKSSTLKRTLDRYFDSMNQTENRQLDELLAIAIYSSGSPLPVVENEDWITFMQKLRPSYKSPSRSTLSNRLLENEYERVEALVQTKLAGAPVLALQIDEWSNRRITLRKVRLRSNCA